jgi:RNA polymerase sigma-70 factor (ECF subfamily)
MSTAACTGEWPDPGADILADSIRFRNALVQHYCGLWRFLRSKGLPLDRADDVTQNAFLVALERLPRIIAGSERAFLYATAVRVVHGIRRRAEREVLSADFELDSSPDPSPEEFTHQKRARELFDALLQGIEWQSRPVFVDFEVNGLTIPEIAESLAISPHVATCRLRRARRQFRALLRELNLAWARPQLG